ncbi:hypothetical protein MNB_SV-6-505 [hydrothermal vent metagenome]|uniref:Uncharacterized protein n=1 Tax=hydrothermal vent metagenome TaxID=652676 RepID=A0A1W1CA83_9ZZZZ
MFFSSYFTLATANELDTLRFTKQILKEKVLYINTYDNNITITFLPTISKVHDGDMVFHNHTNTIEIEKIFSYKLIDGKIVYYGCDGSKYRWSLHSISPDSWVIIEEEDIDGDGEEFSFKKVAKSIYKVR